MPNFHKTLKLTRKRLKELVTYNKNTGLFHWIHSNGHGIVVGQEAGHKQTDGYVVIGIYGKNYKAHRLAHLYVNGVFPNGIVDHEDRVRHNNKWENIHKMIIQKQNNQNTKNSIRNTSGVKGISLDKRSGLYSAYICIDYKLKNLGLFNDFDEAVCHRFAGEQCLDWHGISSAQQYVENNIL